MKYTEKIHAERLLEMLDMKDPCLGCPLISNFYYRPEDGRGKSLFENESHRERRKACKICYEFIGLTDDIRPCPCWQLSKDEAIKRTWLALEAKGYI